MAGRMVVFVFGRGDAVLIFVAILVSKDTEVDVAALDFGEINLISTLVLGWEFFEEKHVGNKAVEYRVAKEKGLQVRANLREFFLHAADEDSKSSRWHSNQWCSRTMRSIILLNSVPSRAS